MKKIISFVFTITFSVYSFSQSLYVKSLYVTKGGSSLPISLQKINETNGNLLNNHNYTNISGYYAPNNLTFNPQTNEIFTLSENTISKYNLTTDTETSINLPVYPYPSVYNFIYGDLIIANNRLFVTRRDYIYMQSYNNYIVEINQIDGSIINSHQCFPGSYVPLKSLTFNDATNEIFGKVDANGILKYNIVTGVQDLLYLTPNVFGDLIIADNRLFIAKENSLLEINQTNGNIISNHNFTSISSSPYLSSLTFDNLTKDIYGISNNVVLKYNINTGVESSFNLPITTPYTYGAIQSINTEETLGLTESFFENEKYEPLRAYNLLGQVVPVETKNEVIIVIYKNGQSRKIINH